MIRETKVGIFIVCAIVMLVGISMLFEDFNPFGSKGIDVTFFISDASGIVTASSVIYIWGWRLERLKKSVYAMV